jgi:hypothetical protein
VKSIQHSVQSAINYAWEKKRVALIFFDEINALHPQVLDSLMTDIFEECKHCVLFILASNIAEVELIKNPDMHTMAVRRAVEKEMKEKLKWSNANIGRINKVYSFRPLSSEHARDIIIDRFTRSVQEQLSRAQGTETLDVIVEDALIDVCMDVVVSNKEVGMRTICDEVDRIVCNLHTTFQNNSEHEETDVCTFGDNEIVFGLAAHQVQMTYGGVTACCNCDWIQIQKPVSSTAPTTTTTTSSTTTTSAAMHASLEKATVPGLRQFFDAYLKQHEANKSVATEELNGRTNHQLAAMANMSFEKVAFTRFHECYESRWAEFRLKRVKQGKEKILAKIT